MKKLSLVTFLRLSLKIKAVAFLLLWSFAMLYICWLSGIRHDYVFYLKIWNLMISGLDPWIPGNSYGPLHNTFAYLISLSDLAPKFLFASSLLFANSLLLMEGIRRRSHNFSLSVYLTTIPFNVLVIGIGFRYGLNDGLIAFFMTCAVVCRAKDRNIAAGALIGLGALLKFYPLLLLPFVALSAKKYKYLLVITGIVVFVIGMVCSYFVWGKSILNPIFFGMDRGPRFLSIFASLDAVFGKNMFLDMLLKYNTLIMILAIIIAFVICVRNKVNWINSLVVGYLTMLTFYKVGHPQYYVPLLFMVFASWIFSERKFDKFAFCYIPLAIFLSLYQISFFYHTSYSSLLWVGQYGGFFAFALALGSIFYSLRGNLSRS